jgi:hypothetical protein
VREREKERFHMYAQLSSAEGMVQQKAQSMIPSACAGHNGNLKSHENRPVFSFPNCKLGTLTKGTLESAPHNEVS